MINVIKKFLSVLFILMFFMNLQNIVLAAPQEFYAEGEYRLGDRDNRETAKQAALADAKRKIVEQVGVYVESYTKVNNFQVTQEQIKTAAIAMIKIKSEQVNFYENGTICKAFVTAIIDTDNIGTFLQPTTNNIPARRISGYEEYNGHYYKIFNEGLVWQEANQRCENMGGHLVTITSDAEQAVVQKLLLLKGTKNSYWLGGYRGSTGNWEWITGEAFSYAHWAAGEPNNAGNENIISIYKNKNPLANNALGEWNDVATDGNFDNHYFFGSQNFGFICEWESADDIK
ncbi:MAG: C-type lectin domain-containing protein [Selenomonadaceae bacterium]|nr:C-type lectin domain-containing protein [Selenomonadaceae bacterium]